MPKITLSLEVVNGSLLENSFLTLFLNHCEIYYPEIPFYVMVVVDPVYVETYPSLVPYLFYLCPYPYLYHVPWPQNEVNYYGYAFLFFQLKQNAYCLILETDCAVFHLSLIHI